MSIIGGNWGVYDAPSKPPRPYLEFDATRADNISGSSWSSSPNSKASAIANFLGSSYFAPENAIELSGTSPITLATTGFANLFQISGINQTPNKFSLELWIYANNDGSSGPVILNSSGGSWLDIRINKQGNTLGGFGTFELNQFGQSYNVDIDVPQWAERWHHLVVSVDSGAGSTNTLRLILNGKEVAIDNLTLTSNSSAGATISLGSIFDGSIGYFALYDDYAMDVGPASYRFNVNDRFRRPDAILETVIDNIDDIAGEVNYGWTNITTNTLTIDWGDGSTPEDFSGGPGTTIATHTYSDDTRRYIIRVLNATGTFEPLSAIGNADIIVIKGKGGSSIEGDFSSQYENSEVISYGGVENAPLDLRRITDFGEAWRSADITSFLNVNMSNAINMSFTWLNCSNLTSFSLVEGLPNCTNFSNTWDSCSSLTSFPLIDTSSGASFSSAWRDCTSLISFPLIDTSSGTNFRSAWRNCSNLTSFPPIDTSSGTDFVTAWISCSSLTSFPRIDTSSGTSFQSTWQGCSSLTSFPLIDTSSGTSFAATWTTCSSLTSFPLIDTSSGTIFTNTWNNCNSLTSFPLINTSNAGNFTGAWASCSSLTSFPALDFSSATNFNSAWFGCTSLTSFPANVFDNTGNFASSAFVQSFNGCALSVQSIENILVSLDTNGDNGVNLNINGGTNAGQSTWTTAANNAYNNLVAKGWSISFNP